MGREDLVQSVSGARTDTSHCAVRDAGFAGMGGPSHWSASLVLGRRTVYAVRRTAVASIGQESAELPPPPECANGIEAPVSLSLSRLRARLLPDTTRTSLTR
jgi:hypothetical protein